ncbi:hypothetical protein FKP32DRAFT_1599785 [Trametes sanguinea]|nr:hypothetical protein FKP32DRAFT_1599785 [Trametes sanguinea]
MQQASEQQGHPLTTPPTDTTPVRTQRTALRARDSLRRRGVDLILRHKTSISEASIALEAFKLELREDIDDALRQNLHSFLHIFEHQKTTVQIALEKYIREENDRIIGAVADVVTYGPHLKINDPELREVWQNMNWRANVQVEVMIMTIRDHYREIIDKARLARERATIRFVKEEWTLRYLSRAWLNPLSEAFDLDASGYVTIAEVNQLMQLRPAELEWSVPRWLAYWAVGWGLGADLYCSRIRKILQGIRSMLPDVLPLNQAGVACYLAHAWEPLLQLALGVHMNEQPLSVHLQFLDYMNHEERRIGSKLAGRKYRIDTLDTVRSILGPGRLEKSIFPLVVLLLQNDYRKIKAATGVVLAESELEHSQMSMSVRLVELYHNQKLHANNRFQEHAWGLQLWGIDYIKQGQFLTLAPDCGDGEDANAGQPTLAEESRITPVAYIDPHDVDPHDVVHSSEVVTMPSHDVVGRIDDKGSGRAFVASGYSFDSTPYQVSGRCDLSEKGGLVVRFTMRPVGKVPTEYTGHLQDELTIVGDRTFLRGPRLWNKFILKRIRGTQMCLRPSPLALTSESHRGRFRALWRYAMSAVIHDIRQRNWSWAYFAERRDTRKRFIEVILQSLDGRNVDVELLSEVHRSCTVADARFYHELARRLHRLVPVHYMQLCNASDCGRLITGARVVCLDCSGHSDNGFTCVSYCDKPCCYNAPSWKSLGQTAPHSPAHNLLKAQLARSQPMDDSGTQAFVDKMRHGELASDLVVQGGPDSPVDSDATPLTPTVDPTDLPGDVHPSDAAPRTENKGVVSALSAVTTLSEASLCTVTGPEEASDLLRESSSVEAIEVANGAQPLVGTSDHAEGEQCSESGHACWDCTICSKRVHHRHGWFCMEPQCLAFVCDKCDEGHIVFCHTCGKPFSPPERSRWDSKPSGKPGKASESGRKGFSVHIGPHRLIRCNTFEDNSGDRDSAIDGENLIGGEPSARRYLALLHAKLEHLQLTMTQLSSAQTQQQQQLATLIEALNIRQGGATSD